MPDPIDRRNKARKGRASKPTSESRRRRRLATLQRTRPQQLEAKPLPTDGADLAMDDLARRLYALLVRRRAIAASPGDTLDDVACKVADWLREHPRDAHVIARHHLGPGAGVDLALPELPGLPGGPDLGGLDDLRVVLEHHAARKVGEAKLQPPPAPPGWRTCEPVICGRCGTRKWLIRPTPATRAAAVAAGELVAIVTRWCDDAGAPHACKL